MEAVVHQALRDVLHLDPRRRLHRSRVDDALVRHAPILPLVEDLEVAAQFVRHVVRIEDRDLGRMREPLAPHHIDVHHRDREDARAPPRCR